MDYEILSLHLSGDEFTFHNFHFLANFTISYFFELIQFMSDILNHIKCIALKVIMFDLHSCFSSGSGDIESGSYEENSPGN